LGCRRFGGLAKLDLLLQSAKIFLQTAHSNVCKSTPRARAGSMLTSIIWALHFGQAGRSIAANGMTDDRPCDWGMMLPSKAAYDRSRDVLQSSSATELSVFSYVK
jgi:hypothetical protein